MVQQVSPSTWVRDPLNLKDKSQWWVVGVGEETLVFSNVKFYVFLDSVDQLADRNRKGEDKSQGLFKNAIEFIFG